MLRKAGFPEKFLFGENGLNPLRHGLRRVIQGNMRAGDNPDDFFKKGEMRAAEDKAVDPLFQQGRDLGTNKLDRFRGRLRFPFFHGLDPSLHALHEYLRFWTQAS